MCGIIGYLGKKQSAPLLLEGLRRLEYRGYDSAGISVVDDKNKITTLKAVGKIDVLVNLLEKKEPKGCWGIGHCLHPKTVVQLNDGRTLYIKDVKDGEKVVNLNSRNFTFDAGLVSTFRHLAPPYIYRVRTPLSDFVATENHKTLVYEKGAIKEKEINKLTKGDLLPLPRKINIVNSTPISFVSVPYKRYYAFNEAGYDFLKQKIQSYPTALIAARTGVSSAYLGHIVQNDRNFREDQLQQLYGFFGEKFSSLSKKHLKPTNTIHGKFIRLPKLSSSSLMQILGYFIGDGYAGERSLRFKDCEDETLTVYKKLIKDQFNLDGRIALMNDTAAKLLEINSTYLSQWLRENVVKDKYKFISQIGRLPDDQLAAFIKGLFDAEGFVALTARQLVIAMTDEFIIRSLQLWLLRFGVLSSIRIEKPDLKNNRINKTYRLSISNRESMLQFQHSICFGGKNKSDKLAVLIKGIGSKRFSFRFIDASQNIILSRVKSIEKILSDTDFVYDLDIKGNHNFLANSIFTHNSRWATHGRVSKENAHPHWDCRKNIFLVHNGIIENYRELKEKLIKEGHKFLSETDTEVLAHLIEKFFRGNLEEAVIKALKLVKGTYGLAIISRKDPEKIVVARNSSPILIGVGDDEYFMASDASAILAHTKKVVYLNDGEIAVITPKGINFTNLGREKLLKKTETLEWDLEKAQKTGYPHFMLKEIFEQPEALRNSLAGRLIEKEGLAKLGGLESVQDKLREIERLIIVACGTAYLAGLVGEYMLEEYAGIPTEVELASEFRYRKPIFDKKTALLCISQSGETADTLAALREAQRKGILTLGIVNVVGSSISRETEAGVYNHIGPEMAVASTKAFTSQIIISALLTLFLGRQRQMSLVMGQRIAKEIKRLPDLVKKVLKQAPLIKKLAKKYYRAKNFLFLGRKYNFPIALEGALKLKEISYIHAEGYAAGEMKHGPIALIDKNFPTFGIAPSDSVYEKMISNLEEIKARGGPILVLATGGNQEIKKITNNIIYIPKTLEMLTPILSVVPLQLFAYYIAVLLGKDVDRPRNLAKVISVE